MSERLAQEKLAKAAKGGDREARNSLFLKYQSRINRLALPAKRLASRIAPDDMSIEPEDIEQQAFLVFCDLLDQWEPGRSPFAVYLAKVMQWRLAHYVRGATHSRRKRVIRLVHGVNEDEEVPPGENLRGLLDRRLEEIESREAWQERTRHISEGSRRWLDLYFGADLSTRQIAALSGRTKRTVNRGLRAAISEVRESLQEGCEI